MNGSTLTECNLPSTSCQFVNQLNEEDDKKPNVSGEKRRSTDQLELGDDGQFKNFGHYMQAKAQKLMHQIHNGVEQKSQLFKSISIHVNGHTNPPASELRRLIVENGGEWHTYFIPTRTTYKIATSLAISKWKTMTKHEVFLRPEWIVDSLNTNTLLPIDSYMLTPDYNPDQQSIETASTSTSVVESFYQRSRLHLISTLAQDLKKFVEKLKENRETHQFVSREKLNVLAVGDDNEDTFTLTEKPIICHIDMDCFFVSVGLRSRPELRGKPVVVTHSKSSNGHADIASCSYEARSYGISNGMWLSAAMERCPQLICIPYEFENYRSTSKLLYSIMARYTLDIKAISCDELYTDLTELCEMMKIKEPLKVIELIRNELFEETGCSASAGLGHSELVARLATRKAKPNGQFYVQKHEVNGFVKEMPLSSIPGIGYSLMEKLQETFGQAKICKDLYSVQLSRLQTLLGEKQGKKIYDSIRGLSQSGLIIKEDTMRKSVSCDVNFGVRLKTQQDLCRFLDDLCARVCKKLIDDSLIGSTLTMKIMIRCPNAPFEPLKYGAHGPCNVYAKSLSMHLKTNKLDFIKFHSLKLVQMLKPTIIDIRGIGLQMTQLAKQIEDHGEMGKILRHLQVMPKNHQHANKMPKIMIKNGRKRKMKTDGRRFVKGRTVKKLPELVPNCICSGDHNISLDISICPNTNALKSLKCFFHQLIEQDQCMQAQKYFIQLYTHIKKEESSQTEEWIKAMEKLKMCINRKAKEAHQMLVIPEKLIQ